MKLHYKLVSTRSPLYQKLRCQAMAHFAQNFTLHLFETIADTLRGQNPTKNALFENPKNAGRHGRIARNFP